MKVAVGKTIAIIAGQSGSQEVESAKKTTSEPCQSEEELRLEEKDLHSALASVQKRTATAIGAPQVCFSAELGCEFANLS